jgi:hypothetical protein
VLTHEQTDLVRQHFGESGVEPALLNPSASRDELAEIMVGQLLVRYADILAELRHRGLGRTNNAPIGDLAQYCAAAV